MLNLLGIDNDKLVIQKLQVSQTEGNLTHSGDLNVAGNFLTKNAVVDGKLTVDTIHVRNIITENGSTQDPGQWTVNTENDLNGKGFSWTHGNGSTRLIYRTGGRLWSNADLDLSADRAYKIDNTEVLTSTALGSGVVKSNLRQVGTLSSLTVSGHANIGEFAFFNPEDNRLGLNTTSPNGALGIIDNDVEIILGAPRFSTAVLGTYTNHDVAIISDNIPRLTVKKNGEVHVGDESYKNGVLKVWGTIHADAIVTDSRIEKTSPLEFKATRDTSVYGLGLVWSDTSGTKQFILRADPSRLWTGESIEIGAEQSYYINGVSVLSAKSLGSQVVESSLTKVGTLQELTVQGTTTLYSDLVSQNIKSKSIEFNNGTLSFALDQNGVQVNKEFSVRVTGSEELFINSNEIVLGNKQNVRRPVKVFGPLSVGVNNPDPSVSLAVNGNISFANRKFMTGTSAPTSGSYVKGDICWNTEPAENSYIGWVCVVEGTPGQWLPFGAISRQ